MLIVGEFYLMEQVMASFEMESYDSWPKGVPKEIHQISKTQKKILADKLIIHHLKKHGFGKPTGLPGAPDTQDHVYNYGNNLTHWALHLMHLNDVAKEGDVDRCLTSLKGNMPFFFGYSKFSKYFTECIDMILKATSTTSEQMGMHLLEASFTNVRGGVSKNVETDLVMEHSVRNKKALVRNLGSNKTELAIHRVTQAADTVADVSSTLEESLNLTTRSTHSSSRKLGEEERMKVKNALRILQPCSKQPGRTMGALHVPSSPRNAQILEEMIPAVSNKIKLLTRGMIITESVSDSDSDTDSELPEIP